MRKRLQFRSEIQHAFAFHEVQRLLAEPVPGGEQRIVPQVVNREREHAVQPIQAFLAPCQIGVQQYAGIGALVDRIAGSSELLADGGEVVDLAVEDDVRLAACGAHRLLASGDSDDRQSPVPHEDVADVLATVFVRPAVADCRIHPLEQRRFGQTSAALCVGQYESAHVE